MFDLRLEFDKHFKSFCSPRDLLAKSSDNILQYMGTAVLRVEGSVLRVLLVGKSIYYVQTDVQTRSLCLELLSLVAIYCPQTFFFKKSSISILRLLHCLSSCQ